MSAQKRDPEAEITARPKRPVEEQASRPVPEEGLSVDPEDLGRTFLADATEQENFESATGADVSELEIVGPPGSDDALSGQSFEADHDVWENTIDISLQGTEREHRFDRPSEEELDESADRLPSESGEVDLTQEDLSDGSLFDQETDQPGEVKSPRIRAEDSPHRRKMGA